MNLNHALPGSWSMLEGLYRLTGQPDNARMPAVRSRRCAVCRSRIVVATGLFADGDLDAAEALVRAFLLQHGDHIEAMRLLARIGIAHKVYDDAELLLAAVLELAPDYRVARQEYASVLVELHRTRRRAASSMRLLRDDPDNRDAAHAVRRRAAVGIGEHERAIELYRSCCTGTPADAEVHLSIGTPRRRWAARREAIESYRRAAACRPDFGDAYWSLANLKTYRFTRRGARADACRDSAACDRHRRSLPPVLCARQGARGSGRVRGVLPLLRAAATR